MLLLLVQDLIVRIHDIHRKAGLMLAGAGAGDPLGSQRLGLFPGIALLYQTINLVLKQPLLCGAGAVGRADQRLQPRRPGIVHHLL